MAVIRNLEMIIKMIHIKTCGIHSDISEKPKVGTSKSILNRHTLGSLNQKKGDGINIQF